MCMNLMADVMPIYHEIQTKLQAQTLIFTEVELMKGMLENETKRLIGMDCYELCIGENCSKKTGRQCNLSQTQKMFEIPEMIIFAKNYRLD